MRVTEQIDALEAMGLNSVGYLIIPRVLAGVIMARSCADYEGIPVHNGSDYEIRMWSAPDSSGESIAQAYLREVIPPHSTSELITEIYYRQWERYFEMKGQIVLIFTNSFSEHRDSLTMELSRFDILKQETLTKEKLDSLGWVINYP